MKVCPSCHTEYADEDVFCKHCGKKLIQANVCPSCGKEVDSDATFCPHCGFNLRDVKSSKHTNDEIEKNKRELKNLKERKKTLKIAGALTLVTGIVLLAAAIALLIIFIVKLTQAQPDQVALPIVMIVLSGISIPFDIVAIVYGIIMLVVQVAVFSKKIENRENAIAEFGE